MLGCRQPRMSSVAWQRRLVLSLAGIPGPSRAGVSGLPVTGEATGVAPLDVIALGRVSAVSGMAPVAPDAAFPIGAGSFFRHVLGEMLVPVSLAALAVLALPGAGGLVILTGAGVRVGYRPAKAGVALRTTGIAHFAPIPGPWYRPPDGIARRPSEGIARRPSRGVKRRTSFSIRLPNSRLTRESIDDSMADARVAAIDATASLQSSPPKISRPRPPWDDMQSWI